MPGERLEAVCRAAEVAAGRIMAIYATDFAVHRKDDASPVTAADHAADETLRELLPEIAPVPVLSEETRAPAFETRRRWERLWLVDPLDGTSGFVARSGEFAVNVALIEDGSPVLGVILLPVRRCAYLAARGRGAFKRGEDGTLVPIRSRRPVAPPIVVATSRSRRNVRTRAFVGALGEVGEVELVQVGSAIKSCLVAEGVADVYPGFSPTSEWDTAAAQVIVEEAGGALVDTAGEPLRYNRRPGLDNPPFLGLGDPGFDWTSLVPPVSDSTSA